MNLSNLLQAIDYLDFKEGKSSELTGLSHDSRQISSSCNTFIAIKGASHDGHDFIKRAIENGALIIFHDKELQAYEEGINYIRVNNTSSSLGEICNVFYHYPFKDIKIVAVTGTNGKTSVANYCYQSLCSLEYKPLLLSTAGDFFAGKKIDLNRRAPSTLETIEFFKVVALYKKRGLTHVCLEATSQALDQNRLGGISIDYAVFTNLEEDHLDYHTTMEHYINSKKKLFDYLNTDGKAIVYKDDHQAHTMVKDIPEDSCIFVSSQEDAHVSFNLLQQTTEGMNLNINNTPLSIGIFGSFNAVNISLVYGVLLAMGENKDGIVNALVNLQAVPGRAEIVPNNKGILALVDYAHSADAVRNFLASLHDIDAGNIIAVLGCGGDRDRTKRPLMAEAAVAQSDIAIFTQDNPRTEDSDQIFKDMVQNLNNIDYEIIKDRELAIQSAVEKAHAGDIIAVLGKGHENYQIIGTEKRYFDDKEILMKYLTV